MGPGPHLPPSSASGPSSTAASATRQNSDSWNPTPWTASPGGPRHRPARRPEVSGHPGRGAGHPGRDHPDPPGADRVLGCLYYAALRPAEAVALRAMSCTLPASGWGQLTLTGSLPRSARAWTGNGTPREPRGLKHRPGGASRTVPIPPQLVRLLHHHLHTHGSTADGRLFRGARGGPLSESRYGRIWHQARSIAAIPGAARLRPYDLRHAALSLWLASGAPPAEVAARAGHSVRVLLTTYAHCIPGCDQIASQHIEEALNPRRWPPAGPQEPAQTPGIPSVIRPCRSWTQRDTAGPRASTQIRLDV